MKLLVTGIKGQLGYDIVKECNKRNIAAVGVDIDEMDITDSFMVDKVIKESNVDAVIHCSAYTAVDKAEDEIDLCRKVNKEGTENIVKVCKELNIPIVYFSTDYVFDGSGKEPWKEYDERNPINIYGLTKYEGELAVETYKKHFILRITWVFGINGANFVKTMLRLGKERKEVNVVNDQIGSPTYTKDVAPLVVDMIQTNQYGTYHVSNSGYCSWYDFACEIFKEAKLDVKVNPVDSSVFPSKAKRPQNSRLSREELKKNGFELLPCWKNALKRYLEELESEE